MMNMDSYNLFFIHNLTLSNDNVGQRMVLDFG